MKLRCRFSGFVYGVDVHKGFNEISSTDGNHIQNPHIRNLIYFMMLNYMFYTLFKEEQKIIFLKPTILLTAEMISIILPTYCYQLNEKC